MPAVHREACPQGSAGWSSCTIGRDVYVDPFLIDGAKPFVLQHELGHVYDREQLVAGERIRIRKVMRWARWRPEAFADFYAGCRLAMPVDAPDTYYGKWRSLRRVAARCRLIARAGV
jgi:hypothetical protein